MLMSAIRHGLLQRAPCRRACEDSVLVGASRECSARASAAHMIAIKCGLLLHVQYRCACDASSRDVGFLPALPMSTIRYGLLQRAPCRRVCEGRHRHRLQTCIRPAGAHMHGRLVDDAYVTSLVPMVSARCAGRPRSGGATVLALAATRMMRRWHRPGSYPNTTWITSGQLRSSCSLTCDASSYVSA